MRIEFVAVTWLFLSWLWYSLGIEAGAEREAKKLPPPVVQVAAAVPVPVPVPVPAKPEVEQIRQVECQFECENCGHDMLVTLNIPADMQIEMNQQVEPEAQC